MEKREKLHRRERPVEKAVRKPQMMVVMTLMVIVGLKTFAEEIRLKQVDQRH